MRHCHLACFAVFAMIGCSKHSQPAPSPNELGQDKRVDGTGVVEYISYSYMDGLPHINVWPVKATPLSALADLDLFSDFRPGLTFQDVANRHGKPSETRTLKNQTELRLYPGPKATLAIGREPLGSYHPRIKEKWTAWAFPDGAPLMLNAIAKQSILDQLELPFAPFRLVLRESKPPEGSVWMTVGSNGVTEVRWINDESTKATSK